MMTSLSRRILRAIAFLALVGSATAHGDGLAVAREYAVKASFIAKFVGFVRWPDSTAAAPDTTGAFVVSVIGTDPFREELREAFRTADLKGRKARIRVVDHVEDLAGSHMVILGGASEDKVAETVRWAAANRALTIGDGDGLGKRGVIINFFLRDDKVRFEINVKAAERSGLQVSSLLLKVARLVGDT
jgi:hypothetical protein